MIIVARVPVNGFTPGQNIPLNLEIINKSDQSVHTFHVELVKVQLIKLQNTVTYLFVFI